MRGHGHRQDDYWEPAQGIIARVETRQSRRRSDPTPEHHYVIDVRLSSGAMVRGTVVEQSQVARAVGHTVPVEVHPKNNDIRLGSSGNQMMTMAGETVNMTDQFGGTAAGFADTGSGMPALGGGLAGILGALGAAGATPGVHMIDASSGQEIQFGAAQGQELQQLAQAMLSGDPAARQAAVDRIRQIKAAQAGQAAAPAAGASTFDSLGPASTAGTFGQPAQNAYGQPVQDAGFGQPVQGNAQQRLANLQQLLDKGILTESEYAVQRQQILGGS